MYTHGQKFDFPKCYILNVRGNEKSHLLVYFDGVFYDPVYRIMHDYEYFNISSF